MKIKKPKRIMSLFLAALMCVTSLVAVSYTHLNVYCEVLPYTLGLDKIREKNPKGIIFTGGPASVYEEDAPSLSLIHIFINR